MAVGMLRDNDVRRQDPARGRDESLGTRRKESQKTEQETVHHRRAKWVDE